MEDWLAIGDWKVFEASESLHAQLLLQNLRVQQVILRADTNRLHLVDGLVEGLTLIKHSLLCLEQLCNLCVCEAVEYDLTLFCDDTVHVD